MAIGLNFQAVTTGVVVALLCTGAAGGAPPRGAACPSVEIVTAANTGSARADTARERAARHLMEIAELDLAIGRVDDGCRMLVVVATTFSDTESGHTARRELGSARGVEGIGAVGSSDVTNGVVSRWREVVVRATGAQDELREAVGDRVFFAQGSADIGGRAAEALNAQAGWLAHKIEFDVVIEGHADDGLSDSEAQALASARAESVRRAFLTRGLPPERISVLSLGSTEPIAACGDAACASQNRRAVTRLVPVSVGSGR